MGRLVGCILLLALVGLCLSEDVTVKTKNGPIKGQSTDGVNSFLGIPYAKPPVGSLRWERPESAEPWAPETYNATKLKPGCPQHGCLTSNPAFVCPKSFSEDCLFLNIWAPANMTSLPVMVYIHGGNFVHMSASSPIYNGEVFVKKGRVVLVTFDYRLGALGFLYTGDRPGDARGNYGILDQKLALEWVQNNIQAFGGDTSKVTLFGQSAGGQSIPIQLMTMGMDLFRNVIIESAPFDIPFKNPFEAIYLAETIKTLLNCTGTNYMPCLRSKTSDEIADAQLKSRAKPTSLKLLEFFEPLGPLVDNDVVPYEIIDAISQNKLRQVPVMIGTTKEEARIFVYEAWQKPLTAAEYIAVLFATYPSKLNQTLAVYPPGSASDCRDVLTKLGTDFIFTCATRNMSRYMVNHGQNVFRYEFNQAFSFDGWGNFTCCEGHVCHGEEIVYVFHSADHSGFNFDTQEEVLSEQMIYYWTNFAYTSDPNQGPHQAKVKWPKFDSSNQVLELNGAGNKVVKNYMESVCDFWDNIGYKA